MFRRCFDVAVFDEVALVVGSSNKALEVGSSNKRHLWLAAATSPLLKLATVGKRSIKCVTAYKYNYVIEAKRMSHDLSITVWRRKKANLLVIAQEKLRLQIKLPKTTRRAPSLNDEYLGSK
jgi:hypothetical protein